MAAAEIADSGKRCVTRCRGLLLWCIADNFEQLACEKRSAKAKVRRRMPKDHPASHPRHPQQGLRLKPITANERLAANTANIGVFLHQVLVSD